MQKNILIRILTLTALSSTALAAEDTVQTLEEMVVVGTDIKHATAKLAKPANVISGDKLRTNLGQTLGETLQNEPGMSNQSFGAGVGTPVIRGQSGSRVRVMQNSLGNNDVSNLSSDHATGVDPTIAERVEILRGPATLLYGSGAIGGVVNVIDNRIPEQAADKIMGGAGEQRYDSATNETSSTVKVEGGKNSIAYHVDGFYRDQGNTSIGGYAIDEAAVRRHDPSFNSLPVGGLQNTNDFISNTQARSRGGSIGLSKIGDSGLIGTAINHLDKNYGIPSDGQGGAPVAVNLKQTKYDLKGQLNKPMSFAEALRMKFGYTDYQHVEMDGGIPGTTFLNKSFESRLELEHTPMGLFKGVTGFQSVNSQFEGLGEEGKIVPKSNINTYDIFAVESVTQGKVTYALGARLEWQSIAAENLASVTYFPVSGSASALWAITDQHQLSLGYTHSERAPQIQELFSDGFHYATRSYEKGNADLNKEMSNNLDLAYQFTSNWMTADINLFHNWVRNYIYQQRSTNQLFNIATDDVQTSDTLCSGCFPLLNTQQAAAIFKGFEAKVTLPLMQNHYGAIDLDLFSDYTRGTFNSGIDVPRLPPFRFGFQLSHEKNNWSSNIRLTRGEAQDHPGVNETTTAGYLLLNLSTQYRIASVQNTEIVLFAKGKNILNENIRNATSYLRNFAPEPGRSAELGIRITY